MIGVTIHQRKPRSEQQYLILEANHTYTNEPIDGIYIHITNNTGKPLYLKLRI